MARGGAASVATPIGLATANQAPLPMISPSGTPTMRPIPVIVSACQMRQAAVCSRGEPDAAEHRQFGSASLNRHEQHVQKRSNSQQHHERCEERRHRANIGQIRHFRWGKRQVLNGRRGTWVFFVQALRDRFDVELRRDSHNDLGCLEQIRHDCL